MSAPQWWRVVDRATGEAQVVQDLVGYPANLFEISPVDRPADGHGAHVDGAWVPSLEDNLGAGLEGWLNSISRVELINHILALVDQRIAQFKEQTHGR